MKNKIFKFQNVLKIRYHSTLGAGVGSVSVSCPGASVGGYDVLQSAYCSHDNFHAKYETNKLLVDNQCQNKCFNHDGSKKVAQNSVTHRQAIPAGVTTGVVSTACAADETFASCNLFEVGMDASEYDASEYDSDAAAKSAAKGTCSVRTTTAGQFFQPSAYINEVLPAGRTETKYPNLGVTLQFGDAMELEATTESANVVHAAGTTPNAAANACVLAESYDTRFTVTGTGTVCDPTESIESTDFNTWVATQLSSEGYTDVAGFRLFCSHSSGSGSPAILTADGASYITRTVDGTSGAITYAVVAIKDDVVTNNVSDDAGTADTAESASTDLYTTLRDLYETATSLTVNVQCLYSVQPRSSTTSGDHNEIAKSPVYCKLDDGTSHISEAFDANGNLLTDYYDNKVNAYMHNADGEMMPVDAATAAQYGIECDYDEWSGEAIATLVSISVPSNYAELRSTWSFYSGTALSEFYGSCSNAHLDATTTGSLNSDNQCSFDVTGSHVMSSVTCTVDNSDADDTGCAQYYATNGAMSNDSDAVCGHQALFEQICDGLNDCVSFDMSNDGSMAYFNNNAACDVSGLSAPSFSSTCVSEYNADFRWTGTGTSYGMPLPTFPDSAVYTTIEFSTTDLTVSNNQIEGTFTHAVVAQLNIDSVGFYRIEDEVATRAAHEAFAVAAGMTTDDAETASDADLESQHAGTLSDTTDLTAAQQATAAFESARVYTNFGLFIFDGSNTWKTGALTGTASYTLVLSSDDPVLSSAGATVALTSGSSWRMKSQ